MKVHELMALLSHEDPDKEVVFTYGDQPMLSLTPLNLDECVYIEMMFQVEADEEEES